MAVWLVAAEPIEQQHRQRQMDQQIVNFISSVDVITGDMQVSLGLALNLKKRGLFHSGNELEQVLSLIHI